MSKPDWDLYPNFHRHEFVCKCGCGMADMEPAFMDKLQAMRTELRFPFVISSGFRCPNHDAEATKRVPGVHAEGIAADVLVTHKRAAAIAGAWARFGFTGKGEDQKGPVGERFIHLDISDEKPGRPRPHAWTY